MSVPTNLVKLTVADSSRMPWEMFHVEQTGADIPSKTLFSDPKTGLTVIMLRYAAGFTNTWHTHPHAHGIYVLDGVLATHEGEFGPGNFVWFPEGGWMEHGNGRQRLHVLVHHRQALRDPLRVGPGAALPDAQAGVAAAPGCHRGQSAKPGCPRRSAAAGRAGARNRAQPAAVAPRQRPAPAPARAGRGRARTSVPFSPRSLDY